MKKRTLMVAVVVAVMATIFFSFAVAMASGNARVMTVLPSNLSNADIIPPSEKIPAEIAFFSGVNVGNYNNDCFQDMTVVVKTIDDDGRSSAVYAVGTCGRLDGDFIEIAGKIENGVLVYKWVSSRTGRDATLKLFPGEKPYASFFMKGGTAKAKNLSKSSLP
jgi:hypothetical protein